MPQQAIRNQPAYTAPPLWQDLLMRIAQQDQAALAAFYDQTHRLVFGLLLAMLRERPSAETVLLDVYDQVWQQAGQAQNQPHAPLAPLAPLAWLMLLARKLALERLRARPQQRPTQDGLSANAPAEPGITESLPESTEVTDRRHRVRRALMRLPIEQRRALELACFAGLTYTEIASQLGRAPAEIKTQLAAGMRALRAHLQPQL